MGFYGIDFYYLVFVVPALLISMYAQFKVNSTFGRYSNIMNRKGITGAQAARKILDMNGLSHVKVNPTGGSLTDNYNPMNKTVNLSESVYNSTSVASLGVAAHETGHAIQDAVRYLPLKARHAVFPVVKISSAAAVPLAVLGFITGFDALVSVGIILFSAVVLFQLITLPVEFNASRRALALLEQYDMLGDDERSGARKVLSAAALTYLASALTAVANLLRLIMLSRNRRR